MLSLKRHPFPVVARFDRVIALSFAFPVEDLAPLVPPGLAIDRYGNFGFLTVALVWTREMRPAGFPAFLGRNFFLAGYRIFTRMRDRDDRNLRGLRIIRSETDRSGMVVLGNLMTGYNYRKIELEVRENGSRIQLETRLPNGDRTLAIEVDLVPDQAVLPAGSPFPDWRTARRFAGPMPFTFSPESDGSFVVIEGVRQQWTPRPVNVISHEVGLFREPVLARSTPVLANAFMVEEIPYRWEKGRVVNPSLPP